MATIERFRDINVWQKARELSRAIYSCSSQGSFARDFGLRDQVRRPETRDQRPKTTNHRLKTRNQNGLALITAMLIVAIVATVAAHLSLGQQVWLRQSQNFADLAQAEAIRSGALHWAALILIDDAKNSATDDLTEDWARQLPPLPAEGGVVVGAIEDAQGRFNLNNVLRNDKPSAEDIGVLQRLLRAQNLEPILADALVDWLDSDSRARPNGGEDIDYLNTEPAYRAANQRLHSVDELRLIKGFDAEAVSKLRPYVTALPQATEININTAPAAVLSALFVELPITAADELAADLEKNPLKSANDLKKRLPAGQALPKVPYGVKSAYFEVSVATQFGRLQRQYTALVHRPAGASAEILWHEQRLPVIDKSEDTEQQADQSGA